jgi:hypothetical protein
MEQWKLDTLPKAYQQVKSKHPDKQIEIWFQDEMRFGNKTRTCATWMLAGTTKRQIKQIGFRNQYIYGAVNPLNGEHVGLVFSECSTVVMNIHLDLISKRIPDSSHALLIMDQAGWHSSSKHLKIPTNITVLYLPPYSPELNPVERLWLRLKDEYLSNIFIKKEVDLSKLGSEIWNKLTNDIVKSVCHASYLSFTNFS